MKILQMTDFVLEQTELLYESNPIKLVHVIVNYAHLLKRLLTIGMFVPCDKDGNVLERKNFFGYGRDYILKTMSNEDLIEFDKYQQAKERVLFKGFEVKKSNLTKNLQGDFLIISETNQIIAHKNNSKWIFNPYKTIEDLISYNLTLNEYKKPPVY